MTATDPPVAGRPLEGATVTFALAVPGVQAVTSKPTKTGGDGAATWKTTIPKGATVGLISVTVIVKTTKYGDTTDRQLRD